MKVAHGVNSIAIQFGKIFKSFWCALAELEGEKCQKMKKNFKNSFQCQHFAELRCILQINFKLQSFIKHLFGNFQSKFDSGISKTLADKTNARESKTHFHGFLYIYLQQ